jgi:hypothetical protein
MNIIRSSSLVLSIGLWGWGAIAVANEPTIAITAPDQEPTNMTQINAVSQLSDIKPSDWAFQALQSLVERYGCITGYPDRSYRGDRTLSRYEFAAGLNACIDRINELIASNGQNLAIKADLELLQKLQAEFAIELGDVQGRVKAVETRVATLQKQQFATTTKLIGQAAVALNAGGFTGDRIISPLGATIATEQPQATVLYRATMDLNTSFTGKDLLKVRLVTGSRDARDNAAGFLEPNLASTLEISVSGRNDRVSIARLYYTSRAIKDLAVTIAPVMAAPDFVDRNRFANLSFLDFSTQALVYGFALMPRLGGSGVTLEWQPHQGPVKIRGLYMANANQLPRSQAFLGGGRPGDLFLFPTGGGGAKGGFLGDPFLGFVEVEYSPTSHFNLRLQCSTGKFFGSPFLGGGVNFDWALSKKVGIFGRYSKASYSNTSLGDEIESQNWSTGVVVRDSFKAGDLAGLAIGQPLAANGVGDATQTNFEAFYNFPVNANLRITPLLQVITHPGNREANGTIFAGTIRTVLSF